MHTHTCAHTPSQGLYNWQISQQWDVNRGVVSAPSQVRPLNHVEGFIGDISCQSILISQKTLPHHVSTPVSCNHVRFIPFCLYLPWKLYSLHVFVCVQSHILFLLFSPSHDLLHIWWNELCIVKYFTTRIIKSCPVCIDCICSILWIGAWYKRHEWEKWGDKYRVLLDANRSMWIVKEEGRNTVS